ncbi:Placenta-specific gene 8 protein [Varanus komodoensis]|nr:Placenta-specific gene 8 protein [Varanus komodoensis]
MEMTSQPIITQPQCHRTTRSFEWQTNLCDCGSDCRICCCGTFCFFCLGCKIAKDMDECCCCGPSVAMRTRYRTLYRIPASYLTIISRPFDMACHRQPRETAGHFLQKSAHGSICSDCLAATCCAPCNLCQLKRDINRRQELGIF